MSESWIAGVHADDRERVAAVRGRRPDGYEIEYRVARPDGSTIHVHDRAEPIRDASGTIVRLAGFTSEVTDVKRLEAQLQNAQKMESLGRLAGGVAHEVNNVLTIVLGQARMARRSRERADDHIGDIEDAAR